MKVNETTLATIRKLDVTADKLFAVTSTEGKVAIHWSGVSGLDVVTMTAQVIDAVYTAQDDAFKQQVSYADFTKSLKVLLDAAEVNHANPSNQT